MQTKTEKLKQHFGENEIKKSLKIFKTFKIGVSKEDQRSVQIAYESMTGKENFYLELGINTEKECSKSIEILKKYLSKS